MNTLDTEFHRRLRKRLDEEHAGRAEAVLTGMLDELEYKRQCGGLKILKDVADWCAEIESNMNKGQ